MPDEPTIREIDGGAASRKLWLAVLTQVLILISAGVAGMLPALAPMLPTVCGSLVTTLALYVGGNVATRWVHTPDDPPKGNAP